MPRMLRFEIPGCLAHIMSRGIDGMSIYKSDDDRYQFLIRLSHHIQKSGHRCLAWCIMNNHYHLLLQTNENTLSKLMRPLNGGYARWFNKKYGRRGYLFQDRYKSILCQDREYSRELIRYIHLNPVRNGDVSTLDELVIWRWSGHAFLLGNKRKPEKYFQQRREALRKFGRNEKQAVNKYLNFLAEGINGRALEDAGTLSENEKIEISGSRKGWPAVIGDDEFAREVFQKSRNRIKRMHRKADYQVTLKRIANEVCNKYAIDNKKITKRGRSNAQSEARALFCYRSHYEELIPLSVIATFLETSISPTARLAQRGHGINKFVLRGKR